MPHGSLAIADSIGCKLAVFNCYHAHSMAGDRDAGQLTSPYGSGIFDLPPGEWTNLQRLSTSLSFNSPNSSKDAIY